MNITSDSLALKYCPVPGSFQGQVRHSFEQPGLVGSVPARGRRVQTRWSLRSLPTQTILWWFIFTSLWNTRSTCKKDIFQTKYKIQHPNSLWG